VEKNSHNIKIYKGLFSLLLAGSLSMTLVGCGVNETSTNVNNTDTSKEAPSAENQNTVVDSVKGAVSSEYDKVKDDNAVETAITIMIDGASTVGNATDEFKQTKEYQDAKEELISNFDTLLGFCFNNQEINGYTFSDVSDNTKEKAMSALNILDDTIERNIPDYKDKAKQKLKEFGAMVYDKSTDLGAYVKDLGSRWLDDVNEKEKRR